MKFILPIFIMILFIYFGWELVFLVSGIVLIIYLFRENYVSFAYIIGHFEIGLIILSILVRLLMLIARLFYIRKNNNFNSFFIGIFSLILILMLCFIVSDFFLFYILFEFSVIPTFILILGWGYSIERLQAGIYIFMYTFITSLPFLFFLISYYNQWGYLNFNVTLFNNNMNSNIANLWWLIIRLVFLVKFPIFLVHIWLPKAHVEAPMAGSMILAGVLLKLGGYGFWKSFQYFSIFFSNYLIILYRLSILGRIFIRLICIRQMDIKCLIAYSSVAHMGPVLGAIITFTWIGWLGAFFIIIAHGICSSGLFFALNCSYEQFKSRRILILKRIRTLNPIIIFWWFFLCCRNMSCPPTANFVSELIIIISVISWGNVYVYLIVSILLMMRGVYSIYLFISINHGEFLYKYVFSMVNIRDLFRFFSHRIPLLLFILFIQFLY